MNINKYIKIIDKSNLFYDTFAFIDNANENDKYINKYLDKYNIKNVEILKKYPLNDGFSMYFVKCRKKYSAIFREDIFPSLDKNLRKHNQNYGKFSNDLFRNLYNK